LLFSAKDVPDENIRVRDVLEGRRKVFFVGAGISVNPPTGFPVAGALISRLLRAVAPDEESLSTLTKLADAGRPDKRNPGDYIRFEQLLDIIQLLADRGLYLLEFIDIFDRPNALHYLLAEKAMAGDVVITTNFDGLIEESIRRLGGQPLSICTTSDFENWERAFGRDRTPVYKIHGSYRRYDGLSSELTPETLQATLSTITVGVADLFLPEAKRKFLVEITRGMPVIVAGYSGGDDLDVMPSFNLLSPDSLLWLSHNSSHDTPRDTTQRVKSLLKEKDVSDLSSRDLFFRTQLLKGLYPLWIFEVNTPSFLVEQFAGGARPELGQTGEPPEARLTAYIKDWEAGCLSESHVKHLIYGHIHFSLGRFSEAHRAYLDAWSALPPGTEPAESANIARMISRVAVDIGRFKEAEHWGRMALDNIPVASGPAAIAPTFHQYGYVQLKLRNFDEALRWFDKAAAISREHNLDRVLSYTLHDSALIYQSRSKFNEAIPLLEESLALSSRDGDIRHVMFSYHQLGTAYYDLGQFSKSREYHLRAAGTAGVIGDLAQIDNSEHELGMLDFLSGQLLDSIRRFRRGIRIARETGRSEYVPMDLQHIAIAFMEGGKLKAAGRYLLKAKEGYEERGDELTLSELHSYIAEYYLSLGENAKALEAAREGLELASREGVGEYLSRADFISGLAEYLGGGQEGGRARMCHAILSAKEQGFMALILDQIYLCARFKVWDLGCEGQGGMARWAVATYSELGNDCRRRTIETFSSSLE
jgi:tetratricopeptide (TPR) repeat protein